jgi:hypothetical protein
VKHRQDLQAKLRGRSGISPDLLYHLCDVLRLDPGWVIAGQGDAKLPDRAKLHTPAETKATVARVREKDRGYWVKRFTGAMRVDSKRAARFGRAAAEAALEVVSGERLRDREVLEALVGFAAQVAPPNQEAVRWLARHVGVAARLAVRLVSGLEDEEVIPEAGARSFTPLQRNDRKWTEAITRAILRGFLGAIAELLRRGEARRVRTEEE